MSTRSYSDVPNRIINLFLQEAGERYDVARGLSPYRRMTPALLARFDGVCAYCKAPWEVEDHLVPRNRRAGGLHAWGNVVPCCRPCNRAKKDLPWGAHLVATVPDPEAAQSAAAKIHAYVEEFGYDPDTEALIPVLASLYEMADAQARGLVRFALAATSHQLGSLARATDDAEQLASAAAITVAVEDALQSSLESLVSDDRPHSKHPGV